MRRFLKVTYFVYFISDIDSEHDTFESFWFWEAPPFFDWVKGRRNERMEKEKCNLVVRNCGKY